MLDQILLFLGITLCVGIVNLIISVPLERPISREVLSFLGIVVGGITGLTAVIVVISALFQ